MPRVINGGSASAQSVKIMRRLHAADGAETREVLDYVPAGSSRRAGLFFQSDPTKYAFEARAESYQEP